MAFGIADVDGAARPRLDRRPLAPPRGKALRVREVAEDRLAPGDDREAAVQDEIESGHLLLLFVREVGAARPSLSPSLRAGLAPALLLGLGLLLELRQRVVPHLVEPLAQRLQAQAARGVEAAPALAPGAHEPGLLEHPEVLRDGAERHVAERPVDLPRRSLAAPQQPQDLPPPRRRQGLQQLVHRSII